MKIIKLVSLGFVLLTGPLSAFSFNLGPFDLSFNGGHGGSYSEQICNAIHDQRQLVVTVEGREIVSDREQKIVTRTLLIEPYAYGVDAKGNPILRGNVVRDDLVKEMTVKYGEEQFEKTDMENNQENQDSSSGLFRTGKEDLDIRKITEIRVVEDSHFDAPSSIRSFEEDKGETHCQLRHEQMEQE